MKLREAIVIAWIALWAFNAGVLQADLVQRQRWAFTKEAERHPERHPIPDEMAHVRRQAAAEHIVAGAFGPFCTFVAFMHTGAFQHGWINPFSREYWS